MSLHAQKLDKKEKIENFNLSDDGVAIKGCDPVSYLTADEPQKGDSDRSYIYKGVTYYFANAQNLTKFKADPDKYEPATLDGVLLLWTTMAPK